MQFNYSESNRKLDRSGDFERLFTRTPGTFAMPYPTSEVAGHQAANIVQPSQCGAAILGGAPVFMPACLGP